MLFRSETINRIDDQALQAVRLELKERLLKYYVETTDVVPFQGDERNFHN